ncbi:MAG: aquaporin family protein [Fusobacteriaceae bacterium]|nr:aquaporin family protein [Fusobacteriaceae bacterium]
MIGSNVYLAEFIGTMLLILFGNGVVAGCILRKNKSENAGWIVITAGWGFAVMIGAYATGWISGAHLNPALTIGLAMSGLFAKELVAGYIVAQFLGAMTGQILVYLVHKLHYDETEDHGTVLATFCTGPAVRDYKWNFITEAVVTMILVFGLLAIGNAKNATGPMAPMLAGGFIWAIGMSLGGPTGYAINPARDLGPRIIHAILPLKHKGNSDWSYSWVPVVGPIVGAIIGGLAYTSLYI